MKANFSRSHVYDMLSQNSNSLRKTKMYVIKNNEPLVEIRIQTSFKNKTGSFIAAKEH
jgi:hypothetical protein